MLTMPMIRCLRRFNATPRIFWRDWPQGQHWAVTDAAERHGYVEHIADPHLDELVIRTEAGADALEEAEGMLLECPECGLTRSHSHQL